MPLFSVQQQPLGLCFVFVFLCFFGRSPFFGFIAFFVACLSVLYHPAVARDPRGGWVGAEAKK
jgi:hypothetical protein